MIHRLLFFTQKDFPVRKTSNFKVYISSFLLLVVPLFLLFFFYIIYILLKKC